MTNNEFIEDFWDDEQVKDNKKTKKKKQNIFIKIIKTILDWVFAVIIAFVIAYLISSVIMFGKVDGHSMTPTYSDGERVLVLQKFYQIKPNDVVIFWADILDPNTGEPTTSQNKPSKLEEIWLHQPDMEHKELHIKRVVGVPGDEVEVKDNYVYVNGKKVAGSDEEIVLDNKYKLGDDEYFVVGDNYKNSLDSRIHGPIKKSSIKGEIVKAKENLNTSLK